jgi:arachidonate 15-lipoxygenase
MRVAGPNPLVITKMTGPLAKFPVSNAQFQSVMGSDDNLDTAIAQARVYIADYAILDWVVDWSHLTYQKHLWAPIAMFAVPQRTAAGRRLQAVAIQVAQQPGADNPIFLRPKPDTQSAEWEKAKTVVQIADGNFHEAISHLGQTHLVVEPFAIATLNQLDGHSIFQLLMPHFEGTLFINNAAQAKLIAPGGTVDAIFGGTIDSSRVAAAKGVQAILFDFGASSVPELLARRGVDNQQQLPYYPYRDIAVSLWDAILAWTTDYVSAHYATEDGPANDKTLQNWVAELTSHEGGRVKDVGEMKGGQEIIATRSRLAKILAIIIFTASAQHSAVNFPQASIMAFAPAMPLAGYMPVPSEGPWLAMLPPLDQALIQLNIGTLLGSVHYTRLGQYGDGYFTDPPVKIALTKFQAALGAIEEDMKKNGLDKAYPYLLPSLIPQSINI